MGGSNSYRIIQGQEDWMREMEKRLHHEERRPSIRSASDLMGPGLAPFAVAIQDWNNEATAFNGFWYSEPGSLNSPDDDLAWIGGSVGTVEGAGYQYAVGYQDPLGGATTAPAIYVRTFYTEPGLERYFTDWSVLEGGDGGGVGGHTDTLDEGTWVWAEPADPSVHAGPGKAWWFTDDDGGVALALSAIDAHGDDHSQGLTLAGGGDLMYVQSQLDYADLYRVRDSGSNGGMTSGELFQVFLLERHDFPSKVTELPDVVVGQTLRINWVYQSVIAPGSYTALSGFQPATVEDIDPMHTGEWGYIGPTYLAGEPEAVTHLFFSAKDLSGASTSLRLSGVRTGDLLVMSWDYYSASSMRAVAVGPMQETGNGSRTVPVDGVTLIGPQGNQLGLLSVHPAAEGDGGSGLITRQLTEGNWEWVAEGDLVGDAETHQGDGKCWVMGDGTTTQRGLAIADIDKDGFEHGRAFEELAVGSRLYIEWYFRGLESYLHHYDTWDGFHVLYPTASFPWGLATGVDLGVSWVAGRQSESDTLVALIVPPDPLLESDYTLPAGATHVLVVGAFDDAMRLSSNGIWRARPGDIVWATAEYGGGWLDVVVKVVEVSSATGAPAGSPPVGSFLNGYFLVPCTVITDPVPTLGYNSGYVTVYPQEVLTAIP